MFPPNNPHYPRNRSWTRCLNGTERKGLYALLTIGIFLCIIFAVSMLHGHQVLYSVSKQHVFGTMRQSYNAKSPTFVNESRRREPVEDEVSCMDSLSGEFQELKGYAEIRYKEAQELWALTIANPPSGHSRQFTTVTEKDESETKNLKGKEAVDWLREKVKRGTMNMPGISFDESRAANDDDVPKTIGFKIEWTQSPDARRNAEIITNSNFKIVREAVDEQFILTQSHKKTLVDQQAFLYSAMPILDIVVLDVLKQILKHDPKEEFQEIYCTDWKADMLPSDFVELIKKTIKSTIEDMIKDGYPEKIKNGTATVTYHPVNQYITHPKWALVISKDSKIIEGHYLTNAKMFEETRDAKMYEVYAYDPVTGVCDPTNPNLQIERKLNKSDYTTFKRIIERGIDGNEFTITFQYYDESPDHSLGWNPMPVDQESLQSRFNWSGSKITELRATWSTDVALRPRP